MIKIKKEYSLLNDYVSLFEQRSINNTTAGIISFFTIMGQVFRNQFIIPTGAGNIDIRVSCFWLQDTRSGKSVSWDFINDISERVGLVCESPTEWSDAGLIGTIEKSKEGEIEETPGILGRCDILQIDEASSLFLKKNYNQSTILYFQTVLNYLFSKTNVIKKTLKAGDITCKPHCSLWLTSFPPREVIDEVLDKGFFQRVIFYPNRVSMDDRKDVSEIRIGSFWSQTENKNINIQSVSDEINDLKKYYKSKYKDKSVLFPKDVDKAVAMVMNKGRGFYKHIKPMDKNNEKILATFIANFENNLTIFATLLAISRKSDHIEEIDIIQTYDILYEIFKNISSWIEEERTDSFKANRDITKIINDLKDKEGWIIKAKLVKAIVEQSDVTNKTAYNRIEKIQYMKNGNKIKVKI